VEVEEAAPGVRVIAFNRPAVRNAFDTTMYQEVTAALRGADGDVTVGAVVLTGRGTAFTSGQDLAEMAAIATGTAVEGAGQGFMGLLECLIDLSVPLLAAVNGVAVGLGFTLLPHCNLVLVDAGARLRVPFAELGVPAASSSLRSWAGNRRRACC
jgi:enoyl-CoA hydratase/carnithine racemase